MIVTPVLLLGLALVAWLTGAAMAVRSVSRIWLRHWVEQRLAGGPAGELYLERPQRLLLAASTGVALTVFAMGAVLGVMAPANPIILTQQVVLYAVVLLVVGQLVPRAVARRFAAPLVPVLLPVLRGLDAVAEPLLAVARRLAAWAVRAPDPRGVEDPREELEDLLREGQLEGVGSAQESQIITGVVAFEARRVGDVMTPRAEIFALDRALPLADLAARVAQAKYSRVPVFDGSLDRVVGWIHAFDVLKTGDDARPPLRRVVAAAPGDAASDLLARMLQEHTHLAIVRDEAGATVGLVTLEDLLEELVGDIRDEHDEP